MDSEKEPVFIIIFGITGDLANRKLLPALYHLTRDDLLHSRTQIFGVTRQKLTKEEILEPLSKYAATHARISPAALNRFKDNFHLLPMDLANVASYKTLKSHLNVLEKRYDTPVRRLYYLSIPPAVFDEVISLMHQSDLHKGTLPPAILVEKPFGYDLKSAKTLINSLRGNFLEDQIYRIDHYLAKEMAQNIIDFRFRNPLFEKIWNNQHIKSITITAHEKIGIESRAAFYENTGALRDLVQSHLLQLLSLVTMERPTSLSNPSSLHRARIRLLKAIEVPKAYEVPEMSLRGQYNGYRKEVSNQNSAIETYAAIRLFINNPRWKNIPMLLRTGKAVDEKSTRIEVDFGKNVLTFRLQPDEGISINLLVKKPGHDRHIVHTDLDFSYHRTFPSLTSPEAYERVLIDAIRQDQTLFASSQEVLASWRIIDPVLTEWSKSVEGLQKYKIGSPGPMNKSSILKLLKRQS